MVASMKPRHAVVLFGGGPPAFPDRLSVNARCRPRLPVKDWREASGQANHIHTAPISGATAL